LVELPWEELKNVKRRYCNSGQEQGTSANRGDLDFTIYGHCLSSQQMRVNDIHQRVVDASHLG